MTDCSDANSATTGGTLLTTPEAAATAPTQQPHSSASTGSDDSSFPHAYDSGVVQVPHKFGADEGVSSRQQKSQSAMAAAASSSSAGGDGSSNSTNVVTSAESVGTPTTPTTRSTTRKATSGRATPSQHPHQLQAAMSWSSGMTLPPTSRKFSINNETIAYSTAQSRSANTSGRATARRMSVVASGVPTRRVESMEAAVPMMSYQAMRRRSSIAVEPSLTTKGVFYNDREENPFRMVQPGFKRYGGGGGDVDDQEGEDWDGILDEDGDGGESDAEEEVANGGNDDTIPYLRQQLLHQELEFPTDTKLWYKEAVFYEVYVRAFCDSSGDGHGDLRGLASKLDYLHNLGVDCLWLLPIYPSPLLDDGYDVADYVDIHPHYGNLDDFKALVSAVHERSMRIIVDFVPNHSSYMHKWFQEARKDRNSPYRDYYVWSDTPTKYKDARIIFVDTEPSNWTWDELAGQYYWHRFYSSQPDLNFENPKVQEEMFKIMAFWFDLGVDGFRVDAVPYLFEEEGTNCENLPKTHDFLRRMRAWIDQHYTGRIILAEACQPPADVCKYFGENGDEFHMGFHFPVMPRIFMSIRRQDYTSLKDIIRDTPDIPPACQWVTFLRNHDELTLEMVTPDERKWMWEQYAPDMKMRLNLGIRRRLASLLDNDRRQIELAYCLLFTLPGSPIIYYGDELGMGDNIDLSDRNGVRTPMQWKSGEANFGFSSAAKGSLYAPLISEGLFGADIVNVDSQVEDPSSLFHAVRHMLHTRKQHPSCGTGKLMWIGSDNLAVAAYIREIPHDWMLVVCNLSPRANSCTVQLPEKFRPAESPVLRDVLTSVPYMLDDSHSVLKLSLDPYQFLWLDLQPLRLSTH